jgi:hypothetical protein
VAVVSADGAVGEASGVSVNSGGMIAEDGVGFNVTCRTEHARANGQRRRGRSFFKT